MIYAGQVGIKSTPNTQRDGDLMSPTWPLLEELAVGRHLIDYQLTYTHPHTTKYFCKYYLWSINSGTVQIVGCGSFHSCTLHWQLLSRH